MQFAATYPLAQIQRVQIYNNIKRYRETELDKILQETGGSFVFGGPIFLSDLTACCHLKGDGVVYGAPDYQVWGMAWGQDAQDYAMRRLPCETDNYVECVALIVDGDPLAAPHYQPDMGGQTAPPGHRHQGGAVCLSCHPDALHPGGTAGRAGGRRLEQRGDAGRRRVRVLPGPGGQWLCL